MFAAALSTFAKFMMIKFGMKPSVIVEGWMWMTGAALCNTVYGKALYWIPKPTIKCLSVNKSLLS
jgi:hypothetical protein